MDRRNKRPAPGRSQEWLDARLALMSEIMPAVCRDEELSARLYYDATGSRDPREVLAEWRALVAERKAA